MNTVYDLSDGRKVMLYMENNRILLLFTPLRPGQMPAVRHNDCLGRLYSAAWHGRIYYVYENLSHQIVFGCLDDDGAAVILSPLSERQMYEGLILRETGGQLCLYYQQCCEPGERRLYMTDPWHAERAVCLWSGTKEPVDVRWYIHEQEEYMTVDRSDHVLETFVWNKVEKRYEKGHEKRQGPDMQKGDEAKSEAAIKSDEAAKLKEENARLKLWCAALQEQLGSAKTQYDQLAQTAIELQKIGKQWRDKYMAAQSKDV